jgi:dTDP-4-dehydrorhamnose reductase
MDKPISRGGMVLVLGAGGQLARALVRGAAEQGRAVRACGRESADLSQRGAVSALIRALRPSCVINAAAYTAVDLAETNTDLAWAVNADGAGEAAAAAEATGARFIHVSTDYVFDGESERPYLETDVPSPINAYGRSKLAGEAAVQTACPSRPLCGPLRCSAEAEPTFPAPCGGLRSPGTKSA